MNLVRFSRRSVLIPTLRGFFLLCLLGLFAARPAAVELTLGPTVEATSTNAVVRWITDVPAGTRVHFGTAPTAMTTRAEGEVGTAHIATLKGLKPGTTYHFTAGTARVSLATNSFTTPGFSTATTATVATVKPVDKVVAGKPAEPAKLKPPPTRAIWGNLSSLPDHFDRHGGDFHAKDPDDYAAQAWLFLQRAKTDGLPAKRSEDGVLRVFDPKTGAFAAYNRDGTAKTYFKPGRRGYFDDQPGTPVDLRPPK